MSCSINTTLLSARVQHLFYLTGERTTNNSLGSVLRGRQRNFPEAWNSCRGFSREENI